MNTCFECKQEINDAPDVLTIVNKRGYYFHPRCARKILSAYIVDTLDRESHIEQRATEQHNAVVLADRLQYHTFGFLDD